MRRKANNKLIGLFILCGVALFFATVGMFVSDKMMKDDNHLVVMYFSETINGLDVGSPVVFKGVTIGKVVKIDIITDLKSFDFKIPVYVSLDESKILSRQQHENIHQVLEKMVQNGLRARLNSHNMLTGQLMVELEFVSNADKAVYHSQPSSDIPEIPTIFSQWTELSHSIQDLPLRETLKKLNVFLDNLNQQVVPQMIKVIDDFSTIPGRTRAVPDTLNSFNKAMQNISSAAKSLGNFADYVERHPESLLRGKGGY